MVPVTTCGEALFSRRSMAFRQGEIVYTEDVGGSSPSSPTIFSKASSGFSGFFAKFPVGFLNLWRLA